MKPSQLSTLIFEDQYAWKGDLDVFLPPSRVTILSQKTGIDEERIKNLTFYTSCNYFYHQTNRTTQVKWVMPLGVRTRKKSFGLQYCPCCLIEDGNQPYFRKNWRLGFITCCLFHSVQLHDKCPKCYHPIGFKKPKKSDNKILYHPANIVHCSKCDFDLRHTKYKQVSKEEYEINRINFLQATLGYGQAGNLEFNYSNLYFEGIRRLLSFLVCSPKGESTFMFLRAELGLYQPYHREILGHNIEPERLDVCMRRTGLLMVYHLLQDWPENFVEACHKSNATSHLIKSPYLEFPFWTSNAFFFRIREKKYYSCEGEKKNIVEYFEKRLKKTISLKQVTRLVHYYFFKR